jgi:hypothetical protein
MEQPIIMMRREFRKALIDNIIYNQNPSAGEREAAYFEYNNGNSEIAKNASVL